MSGADDAGFLSRWSRRKLLVRQGAELAEPPVPVPVPASVPSAKAVVEPAAVPVPSPAMAEAGPQVIPADAAPVPPPAPTLDDVAQLTHQSDYSRFVAPGVDSGVRNAALKKLFTDPHFNVMDRLDTYIDDYGQPDPLPPGMLRQMAQSKFLGLFPDPDPDPDLAPDAARQAASAPPLDGPPATDPTALPEPAPNEDADLRLQPLDAAGPAGPGPGPGTDAGRQH